MTFEQWVGDRNFDRLELLLAHRAWDAALAYGSNAEALALLRELNDALLPIPDALQARVDALLDRAEEKS